ncbi:MAG: deoxyribonuclease IV [Acidobacteriota bacterium]
MVEKRPGRSSGRSAPDDFLGAHISTAGSILLAPERAARLGIRAMQLFTSNQLQWRQRKLSPLEVSEFKPLLQRHRIDFVCSHAAYLINLASPSPVIRRRSIAAFKAETRRCLALGIPVLVFHPGAHMGDGEEAGLARVIDALNEVVAADGEGPSLTVELTAGQGSCLGGSLDHIRQIVRSVRSRVHICVDTCHLLASGMEFRDEQNYWRTFDAIDRAVGLDRIAVFHFNDSKGDLGSRVDRHEHIGEGRIGLEPFHRIMDDQRFRCIPKVLETPDGEKKDPMNLRRLRRRGHPVSMRISGSKDDRAGRMRPRNTHSDERP